MAAVAGKWIGRVSGLLKVLIALNLVCSLLFCAVLVFTFAAAGVIEQALQTGEPGIALGPAMTTVRLVMLIGLIAVPLAHILLTRLRDMVETVQVGDPFVAANAARLSLIAWALLGIQFCDVGFGLVTSGSGLEPWENWQFSVTGWLAVILLFVLARVFAQGTKMRDDLAGVV